MVGAEAASRWLSAKPVDYLSFMWHHTYHTGLAGSEFSIPTHSLGHTAVSLAGEQLQDNGLAEVGKGVGTGVHRTRAIF